MALRPGQELGDETLIEAEHKRGVLACLIHYNFDVSLLMRFMGGNYVGAHRDVEKTAKLVIFFLQHPVLDTN